MGIFLKIPYSHLCRDTLSLPPLSISKLDVTRCYVIMYLGTYMQILSSRSRQNMEFSSHFSDDLLNFRIYSRMDYMYMYLHRYTQMHITWKTYIQWSFQVPKLEVLYHLKPYFGIYPLYSPYTDLILYIIWQVPLICFREMLPCKIISGNMQTYIQCLQAQAQAGRTISPGGNGNFQWWFNYQILRKHEDSKGNLAKRIGDLQLIYDNYMSCFITNISLGFAVVTSRQLEDS